MKNAIIKTIKNYETNISRTRTEIKALEVELAKLRKVDIKKLDIAELRLIIEEIDDYRMDLKVQQNKEMILIQARTDFEVLLGHFSL